MNFGQDIHQEFQAVRKGVDSEMNPYISAEQATRDYSDDAEALYRAMKGFGTDESALISILGSRSRAELHHIDLAYRIKHGKLLTDKIKEECSGNFKTVLTNVIQPPELTDALYLHNAMSGVGTNESILNEIIATREGPEMDKIKMAFVTVFRKGLESMVKGDTSGKYETLLRTLINGDRGKTEHTVDQNRVLEDAKNLYEHPTDAGFTNILGNVSYEHRMAIREVFDRKYGKPIVDIIKKNFSGSYATLLTELMTPKHELLADKLYKAMKGFGTDDDTVIRIISSRYGIDLNQIKTIFQQKYNKSLFDAVKSETSGDYQKILLKLIGP